MGADVDHGLEPGDVGSVDISKVDDEQDVVRELLHLLGRLEGTLPLGGAVIEGGQLLIVQEGQVVVDQRLRVLSCRRHPALLQGLSRIGQTRVLFGRQDPPLWQTQVRHFDLWVVEERHRGSLLQQEGRLSLGEGELLVLDLLLLLGQSHGSQGGRPPGPDVLLHCAGVQIEVVLRHNLDSHHEYK